MKKSLVGAILEGKDVREVIASAAASKHRIKESSDNLAGDLIKLCKAMMLELLNTSYVECGTSGMEVILQPKGVKYTKVGPNAVKVTGKLLAARDLVEMCDEFEQYVDDLRSDAELDDKPFKPNIRALADKYAKEFLDRDLSIKDIFDFWGENIEDFCEDEDLDSLFDVKFEFDGDTVVRAVPK